MKLEMIEDVFEILGIIQPLYSATQNYIFTTTLRDFLHGFLGALFLLFGVEWNFVFYEHFLC